MSDFHVEVFQPSYPDGGYRLYWGVEDADTGDFNAVGQAALENAYKHVEQAGYDRDQVALGISDIHRAQDCPGNHKEE